MVKDGRCCRIVEETVDVVVVEPGGEKEISFHDSFNIDDVVVLLVASYTLDVLSVSLAIVVDVVVVAKGSKGTDRVSELGVDTSTDTGIESFVATSAAAGGVEDSVICGVIGVEI